MGAERHIDPLENPVEYLDAHISGYESMISRYGAEHLRNPLNETKNMRTLMLRGDLEALGQLLTRYRDIAEDFGTQFLVVIRFLDRYLENHTDVT